MLEAEVTELGRQLEGWNSALTSELLDGQSEGQPLYLYLEPERLTALEDVVGAPLVEIVAASLIWREGVSCFCRHVRAADDWEARGKVGAPPFLALLVALTQAAAAMTADQAFSANNYRDRLCGLLGADGARADKLKRDLPETVALWQALNDWLEEWEGALGLPTARVLGHFVNVGYPISQALVRAHDRQAMREAFEAYGLSPRRRVGVAEMLEYLGDWVGRGRAPRNLGRLWSDAHARERIAQVACDELEHGAAVLSLKGHAAVAAPPARLEWIAELALEPFPTLELFLASRLEPDRMEGSWSPSERTDATGAAAVSVCREALEMCWLPSLGALSLEPWDQIGLTSLFSGVLELERPDRPGVRLLRSPTAVLVLAFDERDGRYHEVPRAQLLERCLVLAHDHIAEAVSRHLSVYARPGFQRLARSALPQLPEGWVAFTDVVLVQAADEVRHRRLSGLCAAPATVVTFTGGLRIGESTWHLSRPPEAVAVVEPETASFRLLLKNRRSSARQVLGTFVGRGAVDLAGRGLPAGDLEAQVERRKGEEWGLVRRASLRLRSADHPRPVGVRRDLGLGFDLSRSWSLMSAELPNTEPPTHWARGVMLGELPAQTAASGNAPSLPPPTRRPALAERKAPRKTRLEQGATPHACAVGPHHWLCEEAGPDDDYKTLKWQDCQFCHRLEWTRNRGRTTQAARTARGQRAAARPLSQMPRYAPRSVSSTEAYDLLLDALSYIGSGSIEVLQRLCAELSPDPGFAWRATRDLAALAHIDLAYDQATARPRRWQVTQPALLETAARGLVFVGARSSQTIAAVSEALASVGAALAPEAPDTGPTIWRCNVAADQAARARLSEIVTPLGAGVQVAPEFAQRLAGALPGLAGIACELPRAQVGARGLERFDLGAAVWTESELAGPGAYRYEHMGRAYGFVGPDDVASQVARLGDPALVKHLAAYVAGISLLAYDAARRALTTPLGAELPQLLERVAVACSGGLPRLRADLGQLEYGDVPPSIAQALQRALHAG